MRSNMMQQAVQQNLVSMLYIKKKKKTEQKEIKL